MSATEPERLVGDTPAPRSLLARYFARFDEGEVIRWAFRGLLIGAIGVLALDLRDMAAERASLRPAAPMPAASGEPILPPAVRGDGGGKPGIDPRGNLTADESELRSPIAFELEPGGVLAASGFIDAGAAARFEAELASRGEYVRTVSLNSPGGALEDAMAMARLIRERQLATEVADGALCASSCPLVLAGGEVRRVGDKAAVGLHQFYAARGEPVAPAQAMSDAQATTARISRHLIEMGVDPAIWLHALDTPPRQLYYLSAEEAANYRLATAPSPVASR